MSMESGVTATSSPGKLYFGFGSNLWLSQMQLRCPTSTYRGLGRLKDYKWIINSRGYANVVSNEGSEVYGLVYQLRATDEANLDVNEGVPEAYTKELMTVDFWSASVTPHAPANPHTSKPMEMLVYIDRKRVEASSPKPEYVYRMNMGIRDALSEGMPSRYVDEVLREFIPPGQDEAVAELAKKQAVTFEDER